MAPVTDPPRRPLFLIGLMGCGKTTAGRAAALALDVPFVDNDPTIAAMAGVSTVELARRGGSELHGWESRYARLRAATPGSAVVGVPASCADRADDLVALRSAGLLVYLRAEPWVLARRVLRDGPRPWLADAAPDVVERQVQLLFDRRDPLLRNACEVVVDASREVADVTGAVVAAAGRVLRAAPKPRSR